MAFENWALVASVVFAGLWSGLLAMLTLILHPMLKAMSGSGFARFLDAFLPIARKAPFNYIEVIGMVVAPALALVAGLEDDTAVALTAVALGLTIAGPILVSNRAAEPNYDVILSWDPDALPEDWEAVQRRYFALNWIRAATTWAAFGLLLAALVVNLA